MTTAKDINSIDKKLNLVLLVGGKSSRMGKDKSLLKLSSLPVFKRKFEEDATFFENALSLLYELAEKNNEIITRIFISCREEQKEEMQSRVHAFTQKNKSRGELAFIFDNGLGVCEAIFKCLEEGDCLFIPCDTPFLDIVLLQKLVNAWENNQGNSYTHFLFAEEDQEQENTRKKQPLIAIYTQGTGSYLQKAIDKRTPLQYTIPKEQSYILFYSKKDALFFKNINTMSDARHSDL